MLTASFNVPDSFGVLALSFAACAVLAPAAAVACALRARPPGAWAPALFAGPGCGSLAFLGAAAAVSGLLPRHGTSDPVLALLTGLVVTATVAAAGLAVLAVGRGFRSPRP
jgi:hypothetical protein